MENKKSLSEEELNAQAIKDAMKNFYEKKQGNTEPATPSDIPIKPTENIMLEYEKRFSTETDPDLIVGFDNVKLPSKGIFYKNKISEVKVEYLTTEDEDILSTHALIDDGTVFDVLLERKIKTPNIKSVDLLTGDKNAILLFLRASSYGHEYTVNVTHPLTHKPIKQTIDLRNLKYKEITELPDASGEFTVELPMRKKFAKFRLLTSKETETIMKNAENMQEAYNSKIFQFGTLRLKASVTEINGNRDRSYISKFIDAMPALDSLTIKRKIDEVTPDVDMNYEFTIDGYTFKKPIMMGIDFFFPNLYSESTRK